MEGTKFRRSDAAASPLIHHCSYSGQPPRTPPIPIGVLCLWFLTNGCVLYCEGAFGLRYSNRRRGVPAVTPPPLVFCYYRFSLWFSSLLFFCYCESIGVFFVLNCVRESIVSRLSGFSWIELCKDWDLPWSILAANVSSGYSHDTALPAPVLSPQRKSFAQALQNVCDVPV
ncbi:hypothetical protein L195_g054779, partial [Trifolium pratense]